MNIIGFNFTKLHGNKSFSTSKKLNRSNNLEFTDVIKEEIPLQLKNQAYKLNFKYQVLYSDKDSKKEETLGEILIEGNILVSLNEEESKEFVKKWKNKELPAAYKPFLFNLVLRKCSPKALDLEDTVGLPLHLPVPQIKINKKE